MRSNVCKIDKGTKDLAAILRESEKVAVYNELDAKKTMQLRLLCEELDGMLPELVGDFDGTLVIDFEDGVCKVKVSIELAAISSDRKEQLIGIAKNKKNAGAVGIVGKIRSAVEDFFLTNDFGESFTTNSSAFVAATGYDEFIDYSYYWSLEKYKASVKEEEKKDEWDELEKSVIASIADDVIVGIKGKRADIVVVKNFA